jgi:CBS domain-containing protein
MMVVAGLQALTQIKVDLPAKVQITGMTFRQLSDIALHQNPLTLTAEATVEEACRAMRDRRVGAVLVTDSSGRLTGIFTGRDAVTRVLAEGKPAGMTRLAQVMTSTPKTMPPGENAIEALRLMQDCGCRHIPVVVDDKIVGIVSRGDFRGLELDRLEEENSLWERL